jgi:hypothetical protein
MNDSLKEYLKGELWILILVAIITIIQILHFFKVI